MSPRVIQLPLSGGDRKHYLRQLKAGEQAHPRQVAARDAAYRVAHRLACEEWNTRQFIGGPAAPSPRIEDAIDGGCDHLEVRCKRCGHESLVDLTLLIWPRDNQVHTLERVLRCRACRDARKRPRCDLVALRPKDGFDPETSARRAQWLKK